VGGAGGEEEGSHPQRAAVFPSVKRGEKKKKKKKKKKVTPQTHTPAAAPGHSARPVLSQWPLCARAPALSHLPSPPRRSLPSLQAWWRETCTHSPLLAVSSPRPPPSPQQRCRQPRRRPSGRPVGRDRPAGRPARARRPCRWRNCWNARYVVVRIGASASGGGERRRSVSVCVCPRAPPTASPASPVSPPWDHAFRGRLEACGPDLGCGAGEADRTARARRAFFFPRPPPGPSLTAPLSHRPFSISPPPFHSPPNGTSSTPSGLPPPAPQARPARRAAARPPR
jgi:hypothetical protein